MLKWLLFIMLPKLPRRLSDNPAEHSDYDIGWSLQDGWRSVLEQHIRQEGRNIPAGEVQSLERVRINVAFVKRMGDNEAIAFVRPNAFLRGLPDAALALLLGAPEKLARKVDQAIRREDEDLLSSEHVLVGCEFVDGLWRPFDVQRNYWGIESDTRAGIEGAVQQKLATILRRLHHSSSDAGEEIAQGLLAKWSEIVESHYDLLSGYTDPNQTEQLRITRIEVVEARMLGDDRAAAVVRTSAEVKELPDLALALLLGTRADLAREVHRARSQHMELDEDARRDHVLVYCLLDDGEWDIAGDPEESHAAEPKTRAAIGEAVQLQTSWKEPPFAVTVLGPPELAGDAMFRLPVRVTSVLPRWRMSDVVSIGAFLQTDEDEEGDRVSWDNGDVEPGHTFPGDLALVKGGSHEGYFFFGSDVRSVPERAFTELHYLDATEQVVMVELDRTVQAPERVQFDGGSLGTIWDNPPVGGVSERLRGSQWERLTALRPARIGDTAEAFAFSGYRSPGSEQPWYDLTVLGLPEALDERNVRVRLRVTSREDELKAGYLDFQLSSSPDAFGRLHHLWESSSRHVGSADLPESFQDVSLGRGKTHEAFVYFTAPDEETDRPTEPFTTLWYGLRMFELPILLTSS